MNAFDMIIAGGTVVTASDRARCDVGIRDGKVAALADHLTGAERIIDATAGWCCPAALTLIVISISRARRASPPAAP